MPRTMGQDRSSPAAARRRRLAATAATLLLGAAYCGLAAADGPGRKAAFKRAATERVVHDYLMKHPEIIREALAALEEREAAAEATAKRAALADHRDELLADPSSPALGNPDGDVTIVEFFDYRCGYCKRVEPGIEALLKKDDKVRLVLKEMPILGHDSWLAAKAALAARNQGRYGEFHAALFKAESIDAASIDAIASGMALDMDKFHADFEKGEPGVLEKNHRLASALGINGTPAFVIGDRLVPGAADEATLASHVAAARAARTALAK